MPKRTIRLMAMSSPADNGRGQEQAECLYAVASDETLWMGEWLKGQFVWSQLPSLPQPESDE